MPTAIMFNSCTKKPFSKLTYEGVVYDSLGGDPVAGVTIELRACSGDNGRSQCNNYKVGSSTTDSYGHFKISAKEARSDRYFVMYSNQSVSRVLGGSFNLTKKTLQSADCTALYLN
ncbi:MAG: hypothetical protein JWO44_2272 [Bacteroidetes bacterium]|nr:hypothetical protein [Bacteroidota bacterium]